MKSFLKLFVFFLVILLAGCGGGIHVKVAQGDIPAVKAYIANGGDLKVLGDMKFSGGLDVIKSSLLHTAVKADQLEVAELLLKSGIDVNNSNKAKYLPTPLFLAVSRKMVELLVRYGADIDAKSGYGTAIFGFKNPETTKALLDAGIVNSAFVLQIAETTLHSNKKLSREFSSTSVETAAYFKEVIPNGIKIIEVLKNYKPIPLGVSSAVRAELEAKHAAEADHKRKEQKRMEAIAIERQNEKAREASIEYERQQVIINKKAALIKRNARSVGLESLFKHASESSQICRHLSNIDSEISDFSCEYHVGQERTSKGCENLKEDIEDQLSIDERSVCNISRKAKNQLYDLYGRNNERAVNVAINKSGNRISEREVKRMYPYVKTDLSAIVDEDRAYAQEKHDNRPYETSAWASGAMKAMDRVSKSMPSTQESFRRSQSTFKRSIKKSKRSRYKSNYKPSKYRHVSTTQFKSQLASIDRNANQQAKRDAHAENKSRCDAKGGTYTKHNQNCTVVNNGRGTNKNTIASNAKGKNALAFCWESKRSNDTWRCSGPGQLIQTFEPIKTALKQVGCYENNNQLQDSLYLKSTVTGKGYSGKLFSCNKSLESWSRDIREKYSGIPVHLQ